jgi:hypothetical protein
VEDFEELHEYRGRKRKEFEERIRRTRGSTYVASASSLTPLWLKQNTHEQKRMAPIR